MDRDEPEWELFSGDPGPLEYAWLSLKLPGMFAVDRSAANTFCLSVPSSSLRLPPLTRFRLSFFGAPSCIDCGDD